MGLGRWVDYVASKVERRNEAEDNIEREETQRTNEAERRNGEKESKEKKSNMVLALPM